MEWDLLKFLKAQEKEKEWKLLDSILGPIFEELDNENSKNNKDR